ETDIGAIARENWTQIPLHFPMVTLDKFVVMPDHFHGIIIFYGEIVGTRNLVSQNFYQKKHWSYNKFGPQSGNLGSVIRGYKASVKAYATKNNINFSWQKGYDDRIIKSYDELEIKRNYINNNIKKWEG
ncbi:MAG: hypothetical protein QNK33_02485, partial [Bacteroidales bacterium]|nr:hypothetical protein [Bacteroidales bacterium]